MCGRELSLSPVSRFAPWTLGLLMKKTKLEFRFGKSGKVTRSPFPIRPEDVSVGEGESVGHLGSVETHDRPPVLPAEIHAL